MIKREHTAAVRNPAAVLLSETELCEAELCGRAVRGSLRLAGHEGRIASQAAR